MARWAASTARFSPSPMPVPITAWPMPFMTARTSAKSRLIWPGTVMMSLMPCTAWRSTSSATRKASETGVLRATVCSRRSLGMAITESTHSLSCARPSRAWPMRRLPSRREGQGDHGHRQHVAALAAELAGDRRHHRRRAGAGAAAEAGGDEDHVRALEGVADLLGVLDRGLAAHVGVGAGAQALGELAADLDLDRARGCCAAPAGRC